jgi:hypothetical protein
MNENNNIEKIFTNHFDGFFLSCRNSENECFELIIDFGVKADALSFKNIHNFVRFTDFVKIKIKI